MIADPHIARGGGANLAPRSLALYITYVVNFNTYMDNIFPTSWP